jgi:hypothetical protein
MAAKCGPSVLFCMPHRTKRILLVSVMGATCPRLKEFLRRLFTFLRWLSVLVAFNPLLLFVPGYKNV